MQILQRRGEKEDIKHHSSAKLNDCESEVAETQVWINFAVKCQYISIEQGRDLYSTYNQVLGGLVKMINHPESWLIGNN